MTEFTCQMCRKFFIDHKCNSAHFPDDMACKSFEAIPKHKRLFVRINKHRSPAQGIAEIRAEGGLFRYVESTCVGRIYSGNHYLSNEQAELLIKYVSEAVEKFNRDQGRIGKERKINDRKN